MEIIAAAVTGILALIGVVVSNLMSQRKTDETIRTSQAVMDTKIDELTREVREHNNFAKRMPVVEEKISVINHRIKDLEQEVKNNETVSKYEMVECSSHKGY